MENNKCEKCGGEMVVKENNQTGAKFLACNNFPACKNSKPMPKEDKVEVVDMAEKHKVYDDHKVDDYEEDLFQIKSKQVRSNALASAIKFWSQMKKELFSPEATILVAKTFEKYIRFGE